MSQTCRLCSGKRLLESKEVVARAFFGGAVVLTGLAETSLAAVVCVDCGHVEFAATEMAKLRATYAAHTPLDLTT